METKTLAEVLNDELMYPGMAPKFMIKSKTQQLC